MTILQIQYVLEIAECGNMTKAAERLYVSQPALSLQVKRLEQELGCELFHRTPFALTAAGRSFCEEAQAVAKAWRQLQEYTKLLGSAVCQKVRVGIGPRALARGMFDLTAAFFDQHPETEVTYLTNLGDEILGALEDRRMDLAIDRLPPEEFQPPIEHIAAFELLRERQCILFSRKDPRAALEEIAFTSLDGSPQVSGPEGSLDDLVMKRACQSFGVRMSTVQRADHLDAVMSLVRAGKGIALGPASFAHRYHIAAVPMLPVTYVPLYLLCLKQNEQNPLVRRLRDYLAKNSGDQDVE